MARPFDPGGDWDFGGIDRSDWVGRSRSSIGGNQQRTALATQTGIYSSFFRPYDDKIYTARPLASAVKEGDTVINSMTGLPDNWWQPSAMGQEYPGGPVPGAGSSPPIYLNEAGVAKPNFNQPVSGTGEPTGRMLWQQSGPSGLPKLLVAGIIVAGIALLVARR